MCCFTISVASCYFLEDAKRIARYEEKRVHMLASMPEVLDIANCQTFGDKELGGSIGRRGVLDGGQETFTSRSAKQTQ